MQRKMFLRQKLLGTLLTGTTVAILIAIPYISVSANDDFVSVNGGMVSAAGSEFHHDSPMKLRMTEMVQEGKITQEQANRLDSALQDFSRIQQGKMQVFMSQLPDKTGIPSNTLKEMFASMHQPKEYMNQRIDQMVQEEKITQLQADKLKSVLQETHKYRMEKRMAERGNFMNQLSNETGIPENTLRVLFPPRNVHMKYCMDKMIQEGKITTEQANTLEIVMQNFHQKQKAERQMFMSQLPDKTGISHNTLRELFYHPTDLAAEV